MARISRRTLTLSPLRPFIRRFSHRRAEFIEIDLGSDSAADGGEVHGIRLLEDAIHSIIARRSAPDWLPFVPGGSYWVPPRLGSPQIADLVGKLTNPLSAEEAMSFRSPRGWPALAFFVEGTIPHAEHCTEDTKSAVEEPDGDDQKGPSKIQPNGSLSYSQERGEKSLSGGTKLRSVDACKQLSI